MNRSFGRSGMRDARGQALAEFAMALPLLLFVFLAMVEVGNALAVSHNLSKLTREGANIASRGTSLDTVLTVLASTGRDIHLAQRGGSVVTRVEVRRNGPVILDQRATTGYEAVSRIGAPGERSAVLASADLEQGNTHYVVEIFYYYQPVTPFARLFESALRDPIYDRAVF